MTGEKVKHAEQAMTCLKWESHKNNGVGRHEQVLKLTIERLFQAIHYKWPFHEVKDENELKDESKVKDEHFIFRWMEHFHLSPNENIISIAQK